MAKRQLVITAPASPNGAQAPSIGTRREVLGALANFNIWPDVPGGEFLYGPGLTLQLPPDAVEVTQMLVAIIEEDMAWSVLTRLCRSTHWQLLDLESGRSLSFD